MYNQRGSGLCLERELASQGLELLAQQEIGLSCKGRSLRQAYRMDPVCFGKVSVESKAEHRAQLMIYLN